MANTSKPSFNRQESWRYKRVKPAWRRARGVTSKIRKEESGWPAKVKVGYGTSNSTRGLHPRGLRERLVNNQADLEGLDPSIHIVRISRRVGEKKRLVLLQEIRQRNFHIANPGKVEEKPLTPEEPATHEPDSEPTTAITENEERAEEPEETLESEKIDRLEGDTEGDDDK